MSTGSVLDPVSALVDAHVFGGLPAFHDLTTWRAWLTFIRCAYGLPLGVEDLALFRKHTGRQTPMAGGYPEAVAITGVQSGKSRVAAALADHAALTGADGTHALLLGQDHRGAMRVLLRYCREPFETLDAFRAEVVRSTADSLELRNGVSLSAYPCRPESVRGIRACVVVIDELAFFTATDGRPTDTEMLRVARGRVATTGGKIIVLSSPYGQSGALWDLHRQHYGKDESSTLVWQATAPEMNPTLPADYLARMEADDPEAYRSEVLGEFRTGLATLFDPGALDACVVPGRREVLPAQGIGYRAFADPSGGRADSFAAAVGHRSGDRVIVDAVRAWKPPFNPTSVVAEAGAFLKTYGVREVMGDRYAGEWPREAFRAHGVEYKVAEATTGDNYLALLPAVNAATVELPDVPELLRELRGLERRRGTSGKDRVDHRPGSHDDQAASVAGLVSLLATARRGASMFHMLTGKPLGPGRDPYDVDLGR
jgi:hypothetical protein